jgi:hypothetical protein
MMAIGDATEEGCCREALYPASHRHPVWDLLYEQDNTFNDVEDTHCIVLLHDLYRQREVAGQTGRFLRRICM